MLLAAALSVAIVSAGNAADMTIETLPGNASGQLLIVDGDIALGDQKKFISILNKSPASGTVVVLKSAGGKVSPALDIGIAIREKRLATMAGNCVSACALIWLAGLPRMATAESRIGFHGAFNEDRTPSAGSNALIGAYLARLGFGYETVYELTKLGANDMLWLNSQLANKLSITHTVIKTR